MTSKNTNIPLIKDTIDYKDIKQLIRWLKTNPRLTKGDLTIKFEKEWSKWLGVKHTIFVNSGSSANLAALYALKLTNKLRNNKIVVPAVSWATTVAPAIQLGFEPIMCDSDSDNLGLNINHLKNIIEEHNPATIILVHVLGIPNSMDEIVNLCEKHDIRLVEDTCEAMGSKYDGKNLGVFGDISTFSLYFGHHISTIEGGLVCTNNDELYNILLAIRSHGWDRDMNDEYKGFYRNKYNVDDFHALYTFYYAGFNIRSTDLQAFIGLNQLKKLDKIIKKRNKNFKYYQKNIINNYWKIKEPKKSYVSNFAYPIITNNLDKLVSALNVANIDCRPLICGSINEQPFWYDNYGKSNLPNSNLVHKNGLYIPNNPDLTKDELDRIIEIINKNI